MHHFVYLTFITIDGTGYKYIGKHSTENINDGYVGSGTFVKQAKRIQALYPERVSFTRAIIKEFETSDEAYEFEIEVIEKSRKLWGDFCANVADGGKGKYLN